MSARARSSRFDSDRRSSRARFSRRSWVRADRPLHGPLQAGHRHLALGQVVEDAVLEALDHGAHVAVPRKHHGLEVGRALAQRVQQGQARRPGELEVEDRGVEAGAGLP